MRKQALLTLLLLCLFTEYSLAQNLLKGKILDNDGGAVVGATISSSTKGAIAVSDAQGLFELRLSPADSLLHINKVGYLSQELAILNRELITVFLKRAVIEVEEVAVFQTGYQSIPKERATGSFEHISRQDLEQRVATRIMDKLEGLAPGLQYDQRTAPSKTNIIMRGIGTMSLQGMEPLIVVDNFPYEGKLESINPHDVESVTLLKDAAAASIWGSRAGNGVIVINMKKPLLAEQPIKVSARTNLSVLEKPNLWSDRRMSSSDFIDVELFLFEKGHYDVAYHNPNPIRAGIYSPVVDLLFDQQKGLVSVEDMNAQIDAYRQINYRDELLQHFYQENILQQYSTSFSGGNPKNSWLFSLGYDKDVGGMRGISNQRLSSTIQNSLKLGNKFKVSVNARFSRSSALNESASFNASYVPGGNRYALYPYAQFVGPNGEALVIPSGYNLRFMESLQDGPLMDWLYRPYAEFGKQSWDIKTNYLAAQLDLKYTVLKGLDLSLLYNNEMQYENRKNVYLEESYFARDHINRFTQIQEHSVKYIIPKGGIRDADNMNMMSHRARFGGAYNAAFGERKHEVSAVAGAEIANTVSLNESARFYGYNANLLTTQRQLDYATAHPIVYGMSSNQRIPVYGGFGRRVSRFVSYFGNAAYTYKERYTASFSARKDASNRFGVDANDRWNPLWSTGLAWTISQADFLKQLPWLSNLKLRSSYGHSGNAIGMSTAEPLITIINPQDVDIGDGPYAFVSTLPNPSLKWEDVRMINVALDFSLLGGKLSGSFDYYDKKSTDLIGKDDIDPTAGMQDITRNVGVLQGSGFDANLQVNIPIGKLNWRSRLFLSHSKSVVKTFKGRVGLANSYVEYSGNSMNPLLDHDLYPVFSLPFAGLDPLTGDPIGYLNGEESKEYAAMQRDSLQNIRYHGTALPPYHGSFSQQLTWRGLSFSFLLMFKFGHYFQKETIRYRSLFENWTNHQDYAIRWQQPGDEKHTTVPSMTYPANADRDRFYANSEANIERGDILRLQDVRLAYTFSPKLAGHKLNLSVFSLLNNVGILWRANKHAIDPDYRRFIPSRRLSFGLNCSF